jgi:acyltransferase
MTGVSRSAGIDVVRLLGVVAVVAGHVWTNEFTVATLYPWHVPVFFFLTGWFWKPGRPLSAEVQGRWRTLIRPYLGWFVVIGLAWFPWAIASDAAREPLDLVRPFLGGQYVGRPYSAFWFVTALAVAAVVLRFLERWPAWVRWAVVFVAVSVATVAPGVVRLPPESAGTAIAALVFVLAGTVARRWLPRIGRPALVGVLCLTAGGTAVALGSQPLDLKRADFGTPLLSVVTAIVLCSGLVLVGLALDRVVRGRPATVVSRLASVGITVVLLHAAVIWAAQPVLPTPLVFVAATVVPWTVALLLDRTRLAPWATGRTLPATDRVQEPQPAIV